MKLMPGPASGWISRTGRRTGQKSDKKCSHDRTVRLLTRCLYLFYRHFISRLQRIDLKSKRFYGLIRLKCLSELTLAYAFDQNEAAGPSLDIYATLRTFTALGPWFCNINNLN
jgi:hypothetical protein